MTAEMILDKIRSIIATEMKIHISQVNPEKRITEDLGADSLRKVECVMRIEEAFAIEVSDIEARSLISIRDFSKLVETKTKESQLN